MGNRGPVPKREAERRRRNASSTEELIAEVVEIVPPDADEGWHSVAVLWYESLSQSAQSRFYEPSDWATAFLIAESISRELKPQPMATETGVEWVLRPPTGAALGAWLRAMNVLLATEGDRRRFQVEIHRGKTEPEEVTDLDEYRQSLAGG